ncbi:MAG TPA: sulfite exporter TauE/SafE family protein [Alphaproteobacteria bacterium]
MAALIAMDGAVMVVAAGALLAAFAQGLSGFAFNLVALGLWLHVLAPKVAGPLGIACSLISQCFALMQMDRRFRFDLLWPFLIGGAIGAPLGVWLLDYADPRIFRIVVGLIMLGYSGFMLFAPPLKPLTAGGRTADGGVGFLGGVLGGLAGLSGVVPTAWCMLRGWSKDISRAVYQPFNAAIQAMAMVILLGSGTLTRDVGIYMLVSIPAMALGVWLGLRLYSRISEAQFRRLVLWLLLASGTSLVL